MENKIYSFLFYFGVAWAMLSIVGYILSEIHTWLDFSMIGVVIFLNAIIQIQRKNKK